MTTKAKPAKTLTDPAKEKEGAARKARWSLSPSLNAAAISQAFSIHGELDLGELVDVLGERCKSVNDGDLKRVESMLLSQAYSLDTMFASLARRGRNQEGLKQYETHLKLALKAQSQCRATLETLAAIKNPPIFARQANIAHGPQQVNNENAHIARAEQVENKPNELLEHDHGKRLDTGTTCTAGGSHQAMATVEAVHRPAHEGRKGKR